MIEARKRLKRVQGHSRSVIWSCAVALTISLTLLPTPSPATTLSPIRHGAPRLRRHRVGGVVAELADFTNDPTPSDGYVVGLIHQDFPTRAWHDAEAVAWCESKFRTTDIGFDSDGTHDRGLFQLNDGGTEQYLMAMIGQNPKNLNLAFNPVLNVRAAALLYARDGWSQWSCASAI